MELYRIGWLVSIILYLHLLYLSLPSAQAKRKRQTFHKYLSTLTNSNGVNSTSTALNKIMIPLSKRQRRKSNRFRNRRKRNVHVNYDQNLITKLPTNTARCRIYCRTGYYLQLLPNGLVRGTRDRYDSYSHLELQSFGPSLVRIKGVYSRRYLTIDARGRLKAKRYPRLEESLFREIQEENSYISYSSFKYYFDAPYDIFLGIRGTGTVKKTWKTYPGQMATQFLALKSFSR